MYYEMNENVLRRFDNILPNSIIVHEIQVSTPQSDWSASSIYN